MSVPKSFHPTVSTLRARQRRRVVYRFVACAKVRKELAGAALEHVPAAVAAGRDAIERFRDVDVAVDFIRRLHRIEILPLAGAPFAFGLLDQQRAVVAQDALEVVR